MFPYQISALIFERLWTTTHLRYKLGVDVREAPGPGLGPGGGAVRVLAAAPPPPLATRHAASSSAHRAARPETGDIELSFIVLYCLHTSNKQLANIYLASVFIGCCPLKENCLKLWTDSVTFSQTYMDIFCVIKDF